MANRFKALLLTAGACLLLAGVPLAGSELATSGKSFSQTEAELSACLARKCTPPEDIAASIAHADNLFAAGKWTESAATFEASRGRNRGFARQYPVEVAELLRAFGQISLLRGNADKYRMAMFEAVDVLKEGLGENDPRVLAAQVEVVDVIAQDAMPFNTAENRYQALLKQAQAQQQGAIEGLITYRLARLYVVGATLNRSSYERRALEACDALAASTRPEFAPYAAAAKALRNELGAFYMDQRAFERLVVGARGWSGARPELLTFEPIEYTARLIRAGPRFETQTIVLTFWIQPDGRIRDGVTALGSSSIRNRDDWISPIAASIQSRHYAPIPGVTKTHPGVLRVESYTLTQRGKGQVPLIEMRDLSDWAPVPVEMPSKLLVVGK